MYVCLIALVSATVARPKQSSLSNSKPFLKVARSRHRLTLVAVQVERLDQLCDVLVVELDPKPSPSEILLRESALSCDIHRVHPPVVPSLISKML